MTQVLLAQLRTHAARLVASTLAIVIAVGFVVATLVLNETSRATVLTAAGAPYVNAAAVVASDDGSSVAEDAATLAALPSVSAVAPLWETSVQAVLPGRSGTQYLLVDSVADAPALRWERLVEGSLPDRAGEIAVNERTRAAVGDVLAVTVHDEDGRATSSEARVTGIVDLGGDPTAELYGRAFATPAQARAWGAVSPTELRVAGVPGGSAEAVRDEVAEALSGRALTVQTGEERAEQMAATLTGGSTALTAILLVFATIAVVVAGLVIANTFAVLLAQRTRELALLRAVGATSRQVRRSVLGEAAVTGLAASVVGTAVGIGLAASVSALAGSTESPIPLAGLSVPPYAPGVGLLVGTAVTVLAALAPARASTRVSPLAALRPVDAAPLRSRPGMVRLLLGLLLLLPGVGLLALGVLQARVLVSLPGGVLSFLGLVLLAQRAVPPVVAAAGRLAGRFGGVPARLAAGNATRNPRRTAATATALLIGVTLTSAMVVGAASTRATVGAQVTAEYPTDVIVHGNGLPLPTALLGQVEAVDGVSGAVALDTAELIGPDGQPVWVLGLDPAAAVPVLRSTGDLRLPGIGQVVLPHWMIDSSVREGSRVTLSSGDRSLSFTVLEGADDQRSPLLTAVELAALSPDPVTGQLWVRLGDGANPSAAVDRITDLSGTAAPSSQVTGLVAVRVALDDLLNAMLLIVTGLLAIAVVIALIGVGNTLALSVVERRQENGLLRALGLTRGQLRGLLAWEAVLVGGVAAVLGVLVGGAYGLIGAASVLGEDGGTVLSVPWLQLVAIVVVATLAGLLASVLPARRAARTAPVAAIAG